MIDRSRRGERTTALLALTLLWAAPSTAQEATVRWSAPPAAVVPATPATPTSTPAPGAPAPTIAPACELHVWPAERVHSVTIGWMRNDTVDKALKGDGKRPPVDVDAISPQAQAQAMAMDSPADLLGMPGTATTVHPEPLDRRAARAEAGRHSASAAACYAELIVQSVQFASAPMDGTSLKAMFWLRLFTPASDTPRVYVSTTDAPIARGPSRQAPDPAMAGSALFAAFRSDLLKFGANARVWRAKSGIAWR